MHTQCVKQAVVVAVSVAVLIAAAWLCGCGGGLVGRDSVPAIESRAGTPAPPGMPAPQGTGGVTPVGWAAAPATTAGPLPIPSPAQVFAQLHGAKQASSLLTRDASDFVPTFSHRVTTIEPDAIFSPAWENGYSPFETISWAIYRFDLTARTGRLAINTQWPQPPKDYKLLWLGASDWQKNRWQWYNGEPNGVVQTAAGAIDAFKHPQTGEMYVAVVLLGQTSALLRMVWLTCSLRGDWWMAGRNATHHACSPFKGPDYPTVKWEAALGRGWNGTSVVYDADGTVYFGAYTETESTCYFYALHPDGSQKWVQALTPLDPLDVSREGSATIDDNGTIYYALPNGSLYALNPDGSQEWVFNGREHVCANAAIGPDGTIYVISGTSEDYFAKYLHALDKDGAQRWEYYLGSVRWATAPAVTADGTIYVGCHTDGKFYAFKPDGSVKWTYQAGGSIAYGTPPCLGQNGMVYFASNEPKLYALKADGTLGWSSQLAGLPYSEAALGPDGAIYIGCGDGRLYVFNAGGTPRWSYYVASQHPAVAVDADGTAYVAGNSRLYALSSTGTLKWWFTASNRILEQPVIAEDGTVYVIDDSGMFYAVGPGSQMAEHAASGYVKDSGGVGIPGVAVTITGEEPALTDADGHWSKSGLTDGAYLVSPTKDGYSFSPLFDAVSVNGGDVTVADFAGSPLDPPVWQMLGRDRAHTGRSPYVGPAGPTLKWSVLLSGTISDSVKSQPAIGGDGTVYVQGALNGLYALNADGTLRWKTDTGLDSQASPALAIDGTIYTSNWGADSLLLLAYTPGGVFKWAHEYWVRGSPVVTAEGMLVLDAGGLWELNPDSTQAWFVDLVGWDRENATPAIAADGTIYLGNGYDSVLALNPDGTQKWAFAADHELNKDSQQSTAAVGDDGTIYLRFYHEFYAINPDGTEKWHFDVGTNACSAPAVGADGTVFFASGNITLPETNKLYAFNADGSEKWEYYADGYAFAGSPTLDANGTVYVGVSGPCDIYAFYPDGTVKWVYDTLAKCGPVSIGADGTLYFGDNAGHLYALGPGEG